MNLDVEKKKIFVEFVGEKPVKKDNPNYEEEKKEYSFDEKAFKAYEKHIYNQVHNRVTSIMNAAKKVEQDRKEAELADKKKNAAPANKKPKAQNAKGKIAKKDQNAEQEQVDVPVQVQNAEPVPAKPNRTSKKQDINSEPVPNQNAEPVPANQKKLSAKALKLLKEFPDAKLPEKKLQIVGRTNIAKQDWAMMYYHDLQGSKKTKDLTDQGLQDLINKHNEYGFEPLDIVDMYMLERYPEFVKQYPISYILDKVASKPTYRIDFTGLHYKLVPGWEHHLLCGDLRSLVALMTCLLSQNSDGSYSFMEPDTLRRYEYGC